MVYTATSCATSPISSESATHRTGGRSSSEDVDACAKAWSRGTRSVAPTVATARARGTTSMRALLGSTAREALRAQLSEEQQIASSASRPVANDCDLLLPANKYLAVAEKDVEADSPTLVHATIANMTPNLPHQTARSDEFNMTPSFVQSNYGLPLVNYPVAGLERSRSSRLKTSDLKSWMATEGIPRDGLGEATRATNVLSMQNAYGLPLVNYPVAGLEHSRSSRLKTSDLKSWMATEGVPRDGLREATRQSGEAARENDELHQSITPPRLRRDEMAIR